MLDLVITDDVDCLLFGASTLSTFIEGAVISDS